MPADFGSLNANLPLKSDTNSSTAEELRNSLISARKTTDEQFSIVKSAAVYERLGLTAN